MKHINETREGYVEVDARDFFKFVRVVTDALTEIVKEIQNPGTGDIAGLVAKKVKIEEYLAEVEAITGG